MIDDDRSDEELNDLYTDWIHYNYGISFYRYVGVPENDKTIYLWMYLKSSLQMTDLIEEAQDELIRND